MEDFAGFDGGYGGDSVALAGNSWDSWSSTNLVTPAAPPPTPVRRWDLNIHAEAAYIVHIAITTGGVPVTAKIEFEDLVGPDRAQELVETEASENRIPIFRAFQGAYHKLDYHRKKMQKEFLVNSGDVWFLPQRHLAAFLEAERHLAGPLLEQCLDMAVEGRDESLESAKERARVFLDKFDVDPSTIQAVVERIEAEYPSEEQIRQALSVQVMWVAQVESTSQALKNDTELKIRLAEQRRKEAEEAEAFARAKEAQAIARRTTESMRMQAQAEAAEAIAKAEAAKQEAAALEAVVRLRQSAIEMEQSLGLSAAKKIREEIADLEAAIVKIAKRARAGVSQRQIDNVTEGVARMESFLASVTEEHRAAIAEEIERVKRNVEVALEAPQGAFESDSLDREIAEATQALDRFLQSGGDLSSTEGQERQAWLQTLKGRVALVQELLNQEVNALAAKIAQAETQIYRAPTLSTAFDESLGF